MVTPGTINQKCCGLLFHEALLERGEELFRFCEGQAELLNTLDTIKVYRVPSPEDN